MISAVSAAENWLGLLEPQTNVQTDFGVKFAGPDPFENRSGETFRPASTAKVITASTALETLGEEFRYRTRVTWTAEGLKARDLVVFGSGDPTWGLSELGENSESRMRELAEHLYASGIREVEGSPVFMANDPRWDGIGAPEGWTNGDLAYCYGALARAFNLGLNCMPFYVTGLTTGKWGDSRIRDSIPVNLRTGPETILWIERKDGKIGVRGTLKKNQSEMIPLPVEGTDLWLAEILKSELTRLKIRLKTSNLAQPAFLNSRRSQTREYFIESVPLRRLIQPFLKFSFNLMGEALLLKLGETQAPLANESLRDAGLGVLRTLLINAGVSDEAMLFDGSGLSRSATITPRALHTVLERLKSTATFRALLKGLAIAGVDGTLRNRMQGTRAERQFLGKTGTLDGIASLIGYLPILRGGEIRDWLSVVILGRTERDSVSGIRAAADRVVVRLAQLQRASHLRAGRRESPAVTHEFSVGPPLTSADAPLVRANPFERLGLSYDPRSSEDFERTVR